MKHNHPTSALTCVKPCEIDRQCLIYGILHELGQDGKHDSDGSHRLALISFPDRILETVYRGKWYDQ